MAADLVAEETITVGMTATVQGPSPREPYCIVFEDDGETGYLYGLDFNKEGNPIVDAMLIYNVASVTDRAQPSVVQLIWSADALKGGLLINGYPHAVFDFAAKRGYCRSAFPPGNPEWTKFSHEWSDEAEALLD